MADPANTVVVTSPPSQRQRQTWLHTALGHYQTAVGVAELALPDPFTGVLAWAEVDNIRSSAPNTAWPSRWGGCTASTPPNGFCSTCCG